MEEERRASVHLSSPPIHTELRRSGTMAAASPSLAPEAQKQLLLVADWIGIPLEKWRADVPLGEFEGMTAGVTVTEAGLVVKLDLSGKEDIAIKLADIAGLESLKELNLEECYEATGEWCVGWMKLRGWGQDQ